MSTLAVPSGEYRPSRAAGNGLRLRCALLNFLRLKIFADSLKGSRYGGGYFEHPEKDIWEIWYNETDALQQLVSKYGLENFQRVKALRFAIGTTAEVGTTTTDLGIYAKVELFDVSGDQIYIMDDSQSPIVGMSFMAMSNRLLHDVYWMNFDTVTAVLAAWARRAFRSNGNVVPRAEIESALVADPHPLRHQEYRGFPCWFSRMKRGIVLIRSGASSRLNELRIGGRITARRIH
jgi:hypothetical protein